MNNATFMGRIGKNAELRYTQGGTAVCDVNLAVNRPKVNDQEQAPLWVKAVFWGKFAEAMSPYLEKGKMVAVSGAVDVETWMGKDDGEAHGRLKVTVRDFSFGGGGSKEDKANDEAADAPSSKKQAKPAEDDDIPF